MDYKKEYDEMLQRVKELHETGNFLTKKQMEIICPELAESEDERIRKELIDALKASETVGELKFILPEPTREECVAYLEKQKEQKHPDGCFTCNEYKKGYEEGRRNGFTAGYNKAIKEVEQKEQKPDEIDGKALLHVSNKSYDIGFRNGVASVKPAEWSEEDEKIMQTMIKEGDLKPSERAWLMNLKNRIERKPFNVCEQCPYYKTCPDYNAQNPAQWSEEDDDAINGAIGILLDDNNPTFVFPEHSKLSVGEIVKRLKSLRPQPHWKPSDEQIRPLEYAIEYFKKKKNDVTYLESLYNDLKKL